MPHQSPERNKTREDHSRKSVDEQKSGFGENAPSQNGGIAKSSQDTLTNQSSQHHGQKVSQRMPPAGVTAPMKMSGPNSAMNGNNPSFPPTSMPPNHHGGWNGQRPPMSGNNPNGPVISYSIVPDENLTPEQRQNREAGMASLRKIHEMLLADEQGGWNNMQQMTTDFSHIHMAQDRQVGPHIQPPDEFGVYEDS